ncbi:DEAH-box ATP-dependent RNA helicase prp22 [Dinochytrium kinnereticum]|nr:DEAH-box ATP-dependent RNA helicase prp22 [Dinochytrium kinnereticum]
MGKKDKVKGHAIAADSARLGGMLAASGVAAGAHGLAFGGSSMQVAAFNIDDHALPADAKVIFKRLSKRDSTTKLKASEDLLALLQNCPPEDFAGILSLWPHFFKKLYLEEERRLRENTFQCHKIIVCQSRKALAPILKDIAPYWLYAQFDPAKEVSRLASESFQEVFQKKKEEALSFCQSSILSSIAETVVTGTEETITELPDSVLAKCQVDYDYILDSPEFWKKVQSPYDEIRRALYFLVKSIVSKGNVVMLEHRVETMRTYFLEYCFSEKSIGNYPELWDAVLLLTNAYPSAWSSEKPNPFRRFLTFLKNSCWGTGKISYPAILPLISRIPTEWIEITQTGLFSFMDRNSKSMELEQVQILSSRLETFVSTFYENERKYPSLHVHMRSASRRILSQGFKLFKSFDKPYRAVFIKMVTGLSGALEYELANGVDNFSGIFFEFLNDYFSNSYSADDGLGARLLDLSLLWLNCLKGKQSEPLAFVTELYDKVIDDISAVTHLTDLLGKSNPIELVPIAALQKLLTNMSVNLAKDPSSTSSSRFIAVALGLPEGVLLVGNEEKDMALSLLLPVWETLVASVLQPSSFTKPASAVELQNFLDIFGSFARVYGKTENFGIHIQEYLSIVFRLSLLAEVDEELHQIFQKAWEDVLLYVDIESHLFFLLDRTMQGVASMDLRTAVQSLKRILDISDKSFTYFFELFPNLDELRRPFVRPSSSFAVLGPFHGFPADDAFDKPIDVERDAEGLSSYEKFSLILFSLCADVSYERYIWVIKKHNALRIFWNMCFYSQVCAQELSLGYSIRDKIVSASMEEISVSDIMESLVDFTVAKFDRRYSASLEGSIFGPINPEEVKDAPFIIQALHLSAELAKGGGTLENLVATQLIKGVFLRLSSMGGDVEIYSKSSRAAKTAGLPLLGLGILSCLKDVPHFLVNETFTTLLNEPLRLISKWVKSDMTSNTSLVCDTLRSLVVYLDLFLEDSCASPAKDCIDLSLGNQALKKLRGLLDVESVSTLPYAVVKYCVEVFLRFLKLEWDLDLNFCRFISSLIKQIVEVVNFSTTDGVFLIYASIELFNEAKNLDIWESFSLVEGDIRVNAVKHALNAPDLADTKLVSTTTIEKFLRTLHESFKEDIDATDLDFVSPHEITNLFSLGGENACKIAFQLSNLLCTASIESLILKFEKASISTENEALEFLQKQDEFGTLQTFFDLASDISKSYNHDPEILPYRFILLWLLSLNRIEIMSFDLKRLLLVHLRKREELLAEAIEYILYHLNVGTSSKPVDISPWDVDTIEILEFDPESLNAIPLLCAHFFLKLLRVLPNMVRNYWSNCRSRQRALAMESYTEKYFSSIVVSSELEKVQSMGSSQLESLEVKISRTAGEVTGIYVMDDASVDVVLKFPPCYPLRQLEVESRSGGRLIGITDSRWRSWLLSVSIMAQNSSTLDALLLFQKNITLHFEGKEDCAICYSVVGVIDRTLPSKTCKTCKNYFHASCLYKDIQRVRRGLPIYQHRDELLKAAEEFQILIVVGDTGSGKTTQFPQYLFEENDSRRILVTQPRRIAAVSAATRVAEETNTRLGGSLVGYSIRFESVKSPDTKIVYMTDGTLLRTAASTDPTLKTIADVVVLDEAHERSLETDVLFGLLRRACRERPDLRLVVMSATLNVDKFSAFFDEAPVYVIPGRMFKVDIFYARKSKMASLKSSFIQKAVDTVMQVHKTEEPGDILVFLTGQQDIETTCRLIKAAEDELRSSDIQHFPTIRHISLHPIYSALDSPEQRTVFNPAREGCRKVIVATNIAQTSVTIPGIRYVVDSGFVKEKSFDPKTGVDALLVVPVSKAAATQRAGRAGSKEAFDALDEDTTPEIQRSSLLGTILSLKKFGINDVLRFEFIDPPDPDLVIAALKQLYLLGALDDDGNLTPTGDKMAEFPTSPFISRALLSACETHGCGREFLTLAAMLSSEDPYLSPRGEDKKSEAEIIHARFGHPSGDHLALIRLYNAWRASGEDTRWCRERYIRGRAMRAARNVRDQLADVVSRLKLDTRSCLKEREGAPQARRNGRLLRDRDHEEDGPYEDVLDDFDHVPILRSICSGFFVNTAKRHPQLAYFYHYLSASGLSITDDGSSGKTTKKTESSAPESNSALLSLHIHPSSCLASIGSGNLRGLDWVVYNDVQFVTRANLRIASRIDFSWVEEGLQRVSQCPIERIAKIKVEEPVKPRRDSAGGGKKRKSSLVAEGGEANKKPAVEAKTEHVPEAAKDAPEDRESKRDAAKLRYLARKGLRGR